MAIRRLERKGRGVLSRARASFLARWTAAAVAAWFVIGVILAATGATHELVWAPRLHTAALVAVYLAIGLVTAGTQWAVLRPRGALARRWFWATLLGTLSGAALGPLIFRSPWVRGGYNDWLEDILCSVVAVAVLQGAALWPALRRPRALLWPLLKAGAVGGTAVAGTLAAFFLGGALYGIVFGIPLWLFSLFVPRAGTRPLPLPSGAGLDDLLGYGSFLAAYGLVFGLLTGLALQTLQRRYGAAEGAESGVAAALPCA